MGTYPIIEGGYPKAQQEQRVQLAQAALTHLQQFNAFEEATIGGATNGIEDAIDVLQTIINDPAWVPYDTTYEEDDIGMSEQEAIRLRDDVLAWVEQHDTNSINDVSVSQSEHTGKYSVVLVQTELDSGKTYSALIDSRAQWERHVEQEPND